MVHGGGLRSRRLIRSCYTMANAELCEIACGYCAKESVGKGRLKKEAVASDHVGITSAFRTAAASGP